MDGNEGRSKIKIKIRIKTKSKSRDCIGPYFFRCFNT